VRWLGQPFREQLAQLGQFVSDGQHRLGYRCLGSRLSAPVRMSGNGGHQFLSAAAVIISPEVLQLQPIALKRPGRARPLLARRARLPLARQALKALAR
jgi:hypothetical protein